MIWRAFFGPGWPQVEAAERRLVIGILIAVGVGIGLSGCAMQPTDVQVVEKPVAVPCRVKPMERPTWALDTVQLTGQPLADLVLLWRAAEAEIEQRRAYEVKLEAAIAGCQ